VNCTAGNAFQSKSTIERAWDQREKREQCNKGQPYLSFDLCDRHRTYLCRPPANNPQSRPALCHCCRVPDSPNRSQLDQEPQGRCRVNHRAALCRRCRKSAGVEHLGELSLREVGEVTAFLAPPPVTKLSATGQEQCAGHTSLAVTAVDGISLLQGIEVSAPSPSLPGGFEL
jgi:hypothetical protein